MADVGAACAPLSDEAREELIEGYARLMEECVENAEAAHFDKCFDRSAFWLSHAQSWRQRREKLIASRSPEFIRSLEIRRGLI